MQSIKCDLATIIARASSLRERLNDRIIANESLDSDRTESDARLERWCQVVAGGDWAQFQKRLQWDGLTLDRVRHLLATSPSPDLQELPPWAKTLQLTIEYAKACGLPSSPPPTEEACWLSRCPQPLDPEQPLLFEEILLPLLTAAREQLRLALETIPIATTPLDCIAEPAYLALERGLLQQLTKLFGKTLFAEFSSFRPLGQSLLALVTRTTHEQPKKVHYTAFVRHLCQDGLLGFFQKYPVLAKLAAIQIDFWVEATIEFLQRLQQDFTVIHSYFRQQEPGSQTKGKNLDRVIAIEPFLSDPHNNGRSVISIAFASGLKLIYKPKDLGLEAAYARFLEWCNQNGNLLPLKALKVLSRQSYGWVEYVEHLPCESDAAARRYFKRAGMILCLLYALDGTDCHYENLIACGEHPVLIDLETLMHHDTRLMEENLEEDSAQMQASQTLFASVLQTGMLPRWRFGKDERVAYDLSGLGSNAAPIVTTKKLWKQINTDEMHLAYQKVTQPLTQNIPQLGGKPIAASDFLEDLVAGFEQMYGFLIEQREHLLAESGPLAILKAQSVRFVFRDTYVYGATLRNALRPELMHDGLDRSIELDVLARAFLVTPEKPEDWSVLHSELAALERSDVPYFGTQTSSTSLQHGLKQPLNQYFSKSSYDRVCDRLQHLNPADLAQQVAIIAGAFAARTATMSDGRNHAGSPTSTTQDLSSIRPLTPRQLVREADRLAQDIQNKSFYREAGGVSWIGLSYQPKAERFHLKVLGNHLYDGNCGIALFLGALDYVRSSTEYRPVVLGALQSLRKFLQDANPEQRRHFSQRTGLGGAVGLGSIVYSLTKLSTFLQDETLLADAQQLADSISPGMIAADRSLDVLSGTAGALLGLLALHKQLPRAAILAKAEACGQHLIQQQDRGSGAWKNFADRPLTGFSHGAAGIAYGLLRLYAATQNSTYLTAAKAGLDYERRVFSPEAGNWPDLRTFQTVSGTPRYTTSWCHGAPGIGLARLGALSIIDAAIDAAPLQADIQVALQTTQKLGLSSVDNLCCGNFGRMELRLLASQILDRPELRTIVRQQAAVVANRAAQTGSYRLFANLPDRAFSPGFFQGTAGIGYGLLRLAYPERLPSVLLWE